jgi:hypothetical protein
MSSSSSPLGRQGRSANTGRQIATPYASATFRVSAGRGHFLIIEEGSWQLAARCADWIEKA